jgi:hypothetical protein
MHGATIKIKKIKIIKLYQSFIYSPTDAQVSCLKKILKFKIYIRTARTCFGAVTPSSGSTLFVLAKLTVVKIAN